MYLLSIPSPKAFVRLSLGTQEIFFVATPNGDKQYTFSLDVAESAKDFGQLSGAYSMVRPLGMCVWTV